MPYQHLSKPERSEIEILTKRGYSLRTIAGVLGRSHTSLSRERRRGRVRGAYQADPAQHKAYVRRKYSKYQAMKIRTQPGLETYVMTQLQRHWSPEQIAGRLRLDYGRPIISARTIYKWCYCSWGQPYCRYLARQRYRRKPRGKPKSPRTVIPDRVSITARPQHISDRSDYGHWEADTLGKRVRLRATLVGLVERKSRYLVLKKVENLNQTIEQLKTIASSIPIRSLTLDNGLENRRYQELNLPTYFCDPYRSWQKGQIENAFQRLRRTIPKGTNVRDYSEQRIERISQRLNNTPRKCLDYRTPQEVFENDYLNRIIKKQ